MKRKLAFLFLLVGLTLLIFLILRLVSSQRPKQGVLKVSSVPAASVFLDNKLLGSAPLEQMLVEGEYSVKLSPESTIESRSSWQGKIRVAKSLLTYVNVTLGESDFTTASDILWLEKITSKHAEISITTQPDGATILLDGETKGTTPLTVTGIPAGDHSLSISSPGFASRSIKIKTTPGYKLSAMIKLALVHSESMENTIVEATATPTLSETGKTTPTGSVKTTPTKKVSPTVVSTIPSKPYIEIKDTPTGFLRVRKDASTGSDEIARVNPGETFAILEETDSWYKIEYSEGEEGWVSAQYVTLVE